MNFSKSVKAVPGIMYFLRQPNILRNLIIMIIVNSIGTFNFFLITFTIKNFPGDFTENQLYLNASNIAGVLILYFLGSKFS